MGKYDQIRAIVTVGVETTTWRISPDEHAARLDRALAEARARGLGSLVVFGATRIAYLTGFHHIHTERPIVLVADVDGETALLAPLLEQEHVQSALPQARARIYNEYPGAGPHPMQELARLIAELGLDEAPIGCDHDGYYDVNGYDGPRLSEVVSCPVVLARDVIDEMRMVKSESELSLLRMSAAWGDAAFSELRETIRPGLAPRMVGLEASIAVARRMTAELGPSYRPMTILLGPPVRAVLNAGANTVYPHALGSAGELREGDVLLGYGHSDVGGYIALQGRTLYLGDPGPRARELHNHAVAVFEATLDALRPGRPLADVEAEVAAEFDELRVAEWKRHHSGHGVGLQMHEPPFIDLGDPHDAVPGMVFAIMPGLYVPGAGGFAIADTVVVTESGCERLNGLPYDFDWLTVPA
jgi:Xaa-Pro aminopeptidase